MVVRTWREVEAASDAELLAWAGAQPWAEAMRRCDQDAEWHAEGDVWTHTLMVWDEVERLEAFPTLSVRDRLRLRLTALWHDAGKPETTVIDPETGRTRSPKHSLAGARIARNILRDWGCDLAEREAIVNLVRYHGRPPYLLDQAQPEEEVIRLSWLLSNELLHLFAVADTRGRTTGETAGRVEALGLWRDLAEEHGCLRKPYAFANDRARFLCFRGELGNLHWAPHEEYRCTVVLMSGLPGAGKDTWLRRHRPTLPVVSLDDVREELDVDPTDEQGRVIQLARERCRERLRAGEDFAFNATNLTAQMRRRWVDLFVDYGARVEIVYLEPPVATVLQRNRERERSVPERVIWRLLDRLEVPGPGEAHGGSWVNEDR